jgi:hypothetical protein
MFFRFLEAIFVYCIDKQVFIEINTNALNAFMAIKHKNYEALNAFKAIMDENYDALNVFRAIYQ